MKKTPESERRRPAKQQATGMSDKKVHKDHVAAARRRPMGNLRMVTLRASVPSALVELAKKKTGIRSNRELLETAVARLTGEEGYVEWLIQRGEVHKLIDLDREERESALQPDIDRRGIPRSRAKKH
ncbi:MAG TPA: hypothetical protein VL967_01280 [Terracidiphilus sp.]|nr:hypothetical protein [Terracidiphilus sp.]